MKHLFTLALALLLAGQFVLADDATYVVDGLEKPAEIIVDEWGVPHIYANTHYDAFFVQGFNAARDRLWQIDVWRRRGLGQLAAVLGEEYILQDWATRLFLYRGDMYREWLAYAWTNVAEDQKPPTLRNTRGKVVVIHAFQGW